MTYLDGALLIVGGLSIVRVHNRWARGWPLLTTLAGWSALLLGLGRSLHLRLGSPGGTPPPWGVLAMFASGAVLTFKAYRRGGRRCSG